MHTLLVLPWAFSFFKNVSFTPADPAHSKAELERELLVKEREIGGHVAKVRAAREAEEKDVRRELAAGRVEGLRQMNQAKARDEAEQHEVGFFVGAFCLGLLGGLDGLCCTRARVVCLETPIKVNVGHHHPPWGVASCSRARGRTRQSGRRRAGPSGWRRSGVCGTSWGSSRRRRFGRSERPPPPPLNGHTKEKKK